MSNFFYFLLKKDNKVFININEVKTLNKNMETYV